MEVSEAGPSAPWLIYLMGGVRARAVTPTSTSFFGGLSPARHRADKRTLDDSFRIGATTRRAVRLACRRVLRHRMVAVFCATGCLRLACENIVFLTLSSSPGTDAQATAFQVSSTGWSKWQDLGGVMSTDGSNPFATWNKVRETRRQRLLLIIP